MMNENGNNNEYKPWLLAAGLALFTAVVTAGANAIAEEFKARWKAQRDDRSDRT